MHRILEFIIVPIGGWCWWGEGSFIVGKGGALMGKGSSETGINEGVGLESVGINEGTVIRQHSLVCGCSQIMWGLL